MKEADQRLLSDNQVLIGDRNISMDASVFFQSNLSLLSTLVDRVRVHAEKGDWLIDLFSGVGFFASLLEDRFSRITTVEREPGCLRHAKKNLKKAAEQVTANAESWLLENTKSSPAVLIVDPPRTGLPPEALKVIAEGKIKKMIYVSCNPVTLARDLFQLKNSGFEVKAVEGFAFYPHTPHLEMLLVLDRG
jgi:23S rRNA (uracil1939-C5)-methyltransferase